MGGSQRVGAYAWPKGSALQCPSGTLELRATPDGTHWKTLDSAHADLSHSTALTTVFHPCLRGTWTYQSVYTADDGTYKSAHSNTFSC
jgi:hypothetical protein